MCLMCLFQLDLTLHRSVSLYLLRTSIFNPSGLFLFLLLPLDLRQQIQLKSSLMFLFLLL